MIVIASFMLECIFIVDNIRASKDKTPPHLCHPYDEVGKVYGCIMFMFFNYNLK